MRRDRAACTKVWIRGLVLPLLVLAAYGSPPVPTSHIADLSPLPPSSTDLTATPTAAPTALPQPTLEPPRRWEQPRAVDLDPDWRVTVDSALAPDGARLYLGVDTGKDANQYFTDAIAVYDTTTWQRLGLIESTDWLAFFALSAAGDQVYVVNSTAKTLTIYDTATFETLGVVPNLGGTPSRVLVPTR